MEYQAKLLNLEETNQSLFRIAIDINTIVLN